MSKFEKWLGRTAYQIIPDRFFRKGAKLKPIEGRVLKKWNDSQPNWKPNEYGVYENNYFYGGNLKGIMAKLEYLKLLGFDMIYLTPIELSSNYHHYDVGDQSTIDPWIGDWDDFSDLCKKAHELDILVMVDLVFNHTSTKSKYYNDPRYASWYKKDEEGQQIFWWNFLDMAEVDTQNKDYQETMLAVTESYLNYGADGIRLDLGENLSKEFLLNLQKVKKKHPQALVVGEMWGIATDKEDPKILDGQLDSVMNYPTADAILRWTRYGNTERFSNTFEKIEGYPEDVKNVLLNNVGTHDTPRTITMLVGDKMSENKDFIWDIEEHWRHGENFDTYAFRKYENENAEVDRIHHMIGEMLTKVALTIMYCLPGIPCVFYGTEIGETGYKDPFNRKPYNWKIENKDMTEFVSRLGTFRKANKDILATGQAKIIKCDKNILILDRFNEKGQHLYIAVNRSSRGKEIDLNKYFGENMMDCTISFATENSTRDYLTPYGILIMRKD